ncbi:hypothetical protein HAX54_031864 [Datura stramonium]|uniref:Uncharacterized protein n=1 Tax=Datura stramonium TaxID=4076 RepID=A0ABS8SC65_DATST|nr:hypothetical protein [Datura stramonium]
MTMIVMFRDGDAEISWSLKLGGDIMVIEIRRRYHDLLSVLGCENSSRSLPPPPPPRFCNIDETYVDETYLPRQQPYDVNSTTQLDHDTIDRIYTNFEEDLEDSQDVQEEELEETPTPTSPERELQAFLDPKDKERNMFEGVEYNYEDFENLIVCVGINGSSY